MVCSLSFIEGSEIVYASTLSHGIWKSVDSGKSWQQIWNLKGTSWSTVLFENETVGYAMVSGSLYYDKGLYKTVDGGKTWSLKLKNYTHYGSPDIIKANNDLYAITAKGVFKSSDHGETWQQVFTGDRICSCLAADKNGNIYIGTWGEGLYKLDPETGICLNLDPTRILKPCIDSILVLNDVIYVATRLVGQNPGRGVFKNDGVSTPWKQINEGLTSLSMRGGMVYDSQENVLYAGTQGAGVFKTTPGNEKWVALSQKGLTDLEIGCLSLNNNILYAGTFDAGLFAFRIRDSYTITASSGTGGSISPSGTVQVPYGTSKTFTIAPNSGYKISDVKIDGISVGAVATYTFENVTRDHAIEAIFRKEIVITLYIGNAIFTVNGGVRYLDSPPVIKNNRTILPIRAVVESLAGTVGWNPDSKKVTISLGSTTIELWIGKSTARVNGVDTLIDSANPKVVPEIINGRTMLPLRFVAENLGCEVQWDGTTKTITITYLE